MSRSFTASSPSRFTSQTAEPHGVGAGPNPGGAWSVAVNSSGIVIVIVSTPLSNNVQTVVLCEYDPTTSPTPGS